MVRRRHESRRGAAIPTALAAVAVLVGVAGCGGDDEDKADGKPAASAVAETVVTAAPTASTAGTTGESIIGSTITTLVPTTTVTIPVGLPTTGLGIPAAGQLVLGPSSSLSNAITVRGVPLEEVVTYVREQLAALGWTVNADLTFTGPGAAGQATVAQVGDDVEIQLLLSGAAQ